VNANAKLSRRAARQDSVCANGDNGRSAWTPSWGAAQGAHSQSARANTRAAPMWTACAELPRQLTPTGAPDQHSRAPHSTASTPPDNATRKLCTQQEQLPNEPCPIKPTAAAETQTALDLRQLRQSPIAPVINGLFLQIAARSPTLNSTARIDHAWGLSVGSSRNGGKRLFDFQFGT
jgi:hypothetical protein